MPDMPISRGKKRAVAELFIAVAGVFAVLAALYAFNRFVLMRIPLAPRMLVMIVSQWALFLVPGALMLAGREGFGRIGFTKEKLGRQLGVGVLLACGLSALLTVPPILFGFKDMVGSTVYREGWKFAFQFVYSVLGVALAEEAVFRGYIFHKLLAIRPSKPLAILVSSALFGLFHVLNGNVAQVVLTALLGAAFCLFREKIKGCTLLSLVVAHGVYDALIVLWVSVL